MKILKPAQCSPGGRRPGGLLLTLALSALLIGSGISGAATTDTSDIRRPLLLAGKQSLYERVLSRPDAQLHAAPGEAGVTTDAFSVFYVYGRKNLDDQTWLEVGSNSHGGVRGWIPESQVLAWNQALTVAFREPVGHDRVLLFRDQATLKSLVDIYDIGSYRKMYKAAEEGDVSANSEVVAIQPKAHVDIHDDFYLVPIKQYQDVFLQNTQALLLNVASVPLPDDKPVAKRDFRSGVVFVVDSTTSMGPYIDRTREVVRGVYDSIQNASLDDKVAFGLIAYRDNNEIVPGLEYLTRTYANLEQGRDPTRFFDAVRDVVPAHVSSKGFVEDAYAGIKRAIEDINWKDYDARYVIVVTDAGPRPGDDPLASTGLSDEGLRQLAQDRGVSIWVMHLLTPQGAADHASAAEQYRAVSSFPGIGEFYYGVGTGDVNRFGQALAQLSGDVTRQVGETARGLPPMPVPEVADDSSELQQLRTRVAKLGNALRLRYLAKQAGETAPDLFDAWLLDHYFT
ncbi:MAG: VWA domain-containing protein, partial [Gammaproteobacteria bacterium]|nr:VWA domain-containing protein [Gammaproteobacteria bacterium]